MEVIRCSRCGAFYTNGGYVCPKCTDKDNLELSTFKSYVEENGFSSIDTVATQTGIAQKNITRFAGYQGIEIPEIHKQSVINSGVIFN